MAGMLFVWPEVGAKVAARNAGYGLNVKRALGRDTRPLGDRLRGDRSPAIAERARQGHRSAGDPNSFLQRGFHPGMKAYLSFLRKQNFR